MSRILVFDSGVGGLSVLKELRAALPGASLIFVADNAAFPYSAWEAAALGDHVVDLFGHLITAHAPDLCVIACNTASTLVLPPLRARFAVPFVGTVPAIKPAAEQTRSGRISVLATSGTVKRDYTRALIRDFAAACEVTLVGSSRLAALAEAKLAGEPVDAAEIAAEIAPAFQQRDGRRTDQIVLACTHYPLLLAEFAAAAPWPVNWVDPAPAIARRAAQVLADRAVSGEKGADLAVFTAPQKVAPALRRTLADFRLALAGDV